MSNDDALLPPLPRRRRNNPHRLRCCRNRLAEEGVEGVAYVLA